MSIPLYDDAVIEKFESVFENVVFSEPDRAFNRSAEKRGVQGEDVEVKLPLISIYRENYTIDLERNNLRWRKRGRKVGLNDEETKAEMAESLPVRIDYQLDVWAKGRREVDFLTVELLFWMLDNPEIQLDLSEDFDDFSPYFNWKLEDVTDNSDIMSFEDRGKYYRVTIPFYFDEAMVFRPDRLKVVNNVEVDLELDE